MFIVIVITTLIVFLGIWLQFYLEEDIPNLINISDAKGQYFDYIIVGSGTAGSVVASELARRTNSTVLLVEAGDRFGRLSKIPLLTTYLQKTKNDWSFLSTPQKYSSRGLIKKQQIIPRGKGLGGSSQINYLLHFNGYKRDFVNWKKLGAYEWSFDLIKHYLKDISPKPSTEKENLNNFNEKVKAEILKIPKNYSLLTEIFEKAKLELISKKLNFQRSQYNVKNGERWSVYQMYLKPSFELKNFKILLNSYVDKIVFNKDNHIKSILIRNKLESNGNSPVEIYANKEIILSAGAYVTPQILQLSGIGPLDVLNYLNIQKVHESPNVGLNLFEHLNFPLYVSINETGASLTLNKIISPSEIWKYFTKGEGIFTNINVLGLITKLSESYGVLLFGTGAIDELTLKSLSNFKTSAFRSLFPLHYNRNQEGFAMLSTCYQPLSRGTVQAVSNKITNYPLIDLNFLSDENDINCTIKAVRTAVDIIKSKSFRKLNPIIHWPILNECLDYGPYKDDMITNYPSDKYLECLIRSVGLLSHHPGGTCAIGNNSDSCVNNSLKVQGVSGLRVVDASVLPTPISGTPNSVIIAIAKRAVDLIINEK